MQCVAAWEREGASHRVVGARVCVCVTCVTYVYTREHFEDVCLYAQNWIEGLTKRSGRNHHQECNALEIQTYRDQP